MRLRSVLLCVALICGCSPAPSGGDDAGHDAAVPDGGKADAGKPDAGKPDAGGPDAGPKPDAGPLDAGFVNVDISAWCYDDALAQCWRDVRCLQLSLANLGECIANKSHLCDQTAFTRAVNEGRLQYLPAKAAECLNGYASGSCDRTPSACEVVFAGKVPPDGGCILEQECNTDGFCFQYDFTCPHRCLGWRPMGDVCDGFKTRCDPDNAYCGTSDAGGQRCQPPRNEGQDCVEYDECRSDLLCANNKCVKRNASLGESCGERAGAPYCLSDLFCRQDSSSTMPPPGTCQARGGVGAVCAGYGSCLPSLRCGSNFTTSTCMARAAEGDPCGLDSDCEETLYCPTQTSRCAKIPGDGGDCSSEGSFYKCASAHFCDFNAPGGHYTCLPAHLLGESCTYDDVCLSGDCQYGTLPDGGYGGSCVAGCSVKADGGF